MGSYSKLIFIFLASLFSACCCGWKKDNPNAYQRDFGSSVSSQFSEVVIPWATRFGREHKLLFADSELYYTDSKIQGLRVIFATQNILELNEARGLIVDIVESLLGDLNSDGNIVAAFGRPMNPSDLEIYVAYESYFITYIDPTYIGWVSLIDGYVRYFNGILKDPSKDYWGQRTESYEKALEFTNLYRATVEDLDKDVKKNPHIQDTEFDTRPREPSREPPQNEPPRAPHKGS